MKNNTISVFRGVILSVFICLYVANLLGVDATTVLSKIKQYENGWISLIEYQEIGYTLVPAY